MTTTPPFGNDRVPRNPANEETAVLTPVRDGTDALDRIPVSRQRLWIVITAVLAALLLGAGYVIYYLWDVQGQWETQANDAIEQNYDLGDRINEAQSQIVSMQAEIDLLNEQLDTAQGRVLDLADAVAQRDDDATFYDQEIANLNQVVITYSSVTGALARCIEVQNQLVEYVRDEDAWDPESLATFEGQVDSICSSALSASRDLQAVLAE